MRRIRHWLGLSMDWTELAFNAVAALACWWAAIRLIGAGRAGVGGFGMIPRTLSQAWAFVSSDGALERAAGGAVGCVLLAAGAALAVSAVQGTWWSLRRLARIL